MTPPLLPIRIENPQGGFAICDARLDNTAALARSLGCEACDEAVILHAYRRWGQHCVDHLEGDFSLAVWDPGRAELFLARDRLGVRPLHYAQGPGWFAFASEAKGLLALPEVERASSKSRIAEFLDGRMPSASETMFQSILRLPAGHRMRAGGGRIVVERYWDWRLPAPAAGGDLPDRLAELFTRAVDRRVPLNGTVAATLSGGLDSSAIAATMSRLPRYQNERVRTFSIVFDDDSRNSERPYIEKLVSHCHLDPTYYSPDVEDPFAEFDRLLAQQDGLFLAPTLNMAPGLLRDLPPGAVVLDGHGGDEVISHGYERLHDLARDGAWATLAREAFGASRVSGDGPLSIIASFYQAYGPGRRHLRRLARLPLRGRRVGGDHPSGVMSDGMRRLSAALRRELAALGESSLKGRERHMAVISDPGQQYALEVLDRKAASAGLEARFPFWDQELIDFMLSLPPSEKLRGGWTRRVMREAMQDRLPDAIRWRRDKHDFAHHLTTGLRCSPSASVDRFRQDAERLSPFLDLAAVETVIGRVAASGPVAPGFDLQVLWRATAVAEWLDYAAKNNIRIVS